MCIEDIRIGNKRNFRLTTVPLGTSVAFAGDGKRVLFRVTASAAGTGTVNVIHTQTGVLVASTRGTTPVVTELSLEVHGMIVHEPLTVTTTITDAGVMEVLLDNQTDAPVPMGK